MSLYFLCLSILIFGFLFVFWGRLTVRLSLEFSRSGWLTGVWFLPALAWATQKDLPLGWVFTAEAGAAFISGLMGPLGFLSLHFGFWQGLWAEFAYQKLGSPWGVAAACIFADLSLLWLHPHLKFLRTKGWRSWMKHAVGVGVSAFLLAALACQAWAVEGESYCRDLPFARYGWTGDLPQEEFLIAVDYDGTVLDTDGYLIQKVIPKALERLTPDLAYDSQIEFFKFRRWLLTSDLKSLPSSYTEEAWSASDAWPFPMDFLPTDLPKKMGLPSHSRPIEGFWRLMSNIFRSLGEQGESVSTIEEFQEFYKDVNLYFGKKVRWIVITARTLPMTRGILERFKEMGETVYSIQILHRGSRPTQNSHDSAHGKLEQLLELSKKGPPLRVFLDNDPVNLQAVRQSLGETITTLWIQSVGKGKFKISRPLCAWALGKVADAFSDCCYYE